MTTTTTDPLNGLLAIRDSYISARWNFVDAIGTPLATPGGIGNSVSGLTYSFPTAKPSYATVTGFVAFADFQKQAAREVLTAISETIQVSFSEVTGVGAITLATNSQAGGSGYAYYPTHAYSYSDAPPNNIATAVPMDVAGDVWLNKNVGWTAEDFTPNGSGYGTLLHELGHALGLKHPFATDSNGYILDPSVDNTAYTVMSYTDHPYGLYRTVTETSPGSYTWSYRYIEPETLMPFDLAALQYLYGANLTTRTGNDTYTFATDRPFIRTIWDGGGSDTISVSNFTLGCVIDLRPGYFSSISIPSDPLPAGYTETNVGIYDGTANLAIANGVTIEKAIGGAGNDQLTGNTAANTLDGQGGNDTMAGGSGNDTYLVDSSLDVVTENSSEGTDTVKAGFTYTLGSNLEKLVLTGSSAVNGTGNGLKNTLTGNSAVNQLKGLGGNDTLSGGGGGDTLDGGGGADRLSGGTGNDTYLVDNTQDVAMENSGEGSDTLKASVTYTLAANLEKLILTGSVAINGTGNELNNTLTGNTGGNTLFGLNGNDTLGGGDGADTLYGGSGNDKLTGGAGQDIFVFDTALNGSNNVDTLTDFSVTDDTLWLDLDIFSAFTSSAPLATGAFYKGAGIVAAHDASDRIVYNTSTGDLFYDADGTGSATSAVKIAILGTTTHPAVTAADFLVVA